MYENFPSKLVTNRKIAIGLGISAVGISAVGISAVGISAVGPAFADEFKSITNYNLDDVAFQICKDEYDIYENAASMHIGDPHLLSEWKQYTQCHNDAFLVLDETKHLCAEQIEKAKNTKIVNDMQEPLERQMSGSRMIYEYEKAIDCHIL